MRNSVISISKSIPQIMASRLSRTLVSFHPPSTQSISLRPRHSILPFRIMSHTRRFSPTLRLYQYRICPFCNIIKAVLSYAGVDYERVEVNPLTKKELKPWSDYKKVPIAVLNDQPINGSESIIETILSLPSVQYNLSHRWSLTPTPMTLSQFSSPSSRLRLQFASDELAGVIYPNLCSTLSDSYEAFGYVNEVEEFSSWEKVTVRWLGAAAMNLAASRVKCEILHRFLRIALLTIVSPYFTSALSPAKRKIVDERAALRDALDGFERDGLKNGTLPYSSGNDHSPDLGDLAVFGVLHAVRDLRVYEDAVRNRGGVIREWYDRMDDVVFRENAGM